ncbi:hypothetical protein VTJ49DRAFT_904 [Mycothermus thermophilus]|uniref:Alpha/beta hydrolase fold-3 domain-containing protein n=1 Tax=Humicola insolens TaxID=85995 RepID=A0ABR3VFG5_HUMIN
MSATFVFALVAFAAAAAAAVWASMAHLDLIVSGVVFGALLELAGPAPEAHPERVQAGSPHELGVISLRRFLDSEITWSLTQAQQEGPRGCFMVESVWTSPCAIPVPTESAIVKTLKLAIMQLPACSWMAPCWYDWEMPKPSPVKCEWIGFRKDPKLPGLSPSESYDKVMEEATSDTVVLYFHGGSYYGGGKPASRRIARDLAQRTGGRVLSIQCRLSPEHPFPAALLDALSAYLYLLHPCDGALHSPINRWNIVLAGHGAGAHLALGLMKVLHHINRGKDFPPKLMWNNRHCYLFPPAGLAMISPWVDITHSSPSWNDEETGKWDYLPSLDRQLAQGSQRPPCDLWPTNPPRLHPLCDDHWLFHPLVTPILDWQWKGFPPVYICHGQERVADEIRFFALERLKRCGVEVTLEEYQAMPHCFPLRFPHLKQSRHCTNSMAAFIAKVTAEPPDPDRLRYKIPHSRTFLIEAPSANAVERPFTAEDLRTRSKREMGEDMSVVVLKRGFPLRYSPFPPDTRLWGIVLA